MKRVSNRVEVFRGKLLCWFYIPALFWLIISVAVGTGIRYHWHTPWITAFTMPNLIHAHTHAALLGWVYLVMAGFTLQYFISRKTAEKTIIPMAIGIQVSNVGMLISFALQGYAFGSIFFSSVHLFLTLWLAILFLISPNKNEKSLSRDFAAAAWLWHVLSGFGPFALAFTGGMSGTMAQFWLGSYLFLLLNGWIIFMMLAMWYRVPEVAAKTGKKERFGFNLMFITLLPALISMLYPLGISDSLIRIGFVFNLLHGFGILLLLPSLWPGKSSPVVVRTVLIIAVIMLGLKAVVQPLSYFPDLIFLTQNHFLKVGFIHMVLLALVTPLLLVLIFRTVRRNTIFAHVITATVLIAVLLTTLILFWIPLGSMAGIYLNLPYNLIMALLGFVFMLATAGVLWNEISKYCSNI